MLHVGPETLPSVVLRDGPFVAEHGDLSQMLRYLRMVGSSFFILRVGMSFMKSTNHSCFSHSQYSSICCDSLAEFIFFCCLRCRWLYTPATIAMAVAPTRPITAPAMATFSSSSNSVIPRWGKRPLAIKRIPPCPAVPYLSTELATEPSCLLLCAGGCSHT